MGFAVLRALCVATAAGMLSACLPMPPMPQLTLTPEDMPSLSPGMSVPQVQDALRDRTYWRFTASQTSDVIPFHAMARYERPLTHWFTVPDRTGRETICVKSRVIDKLFYFVFTAGTLSKIVDVDVLKSEFGKTEEERDATYASQVLGDSGISAAEMHQAIEAALPGENRYRRASEPPPIALIWPFILEPDLRNESEFLKAHDGLSIRLGESPSAVRDRFGKPTQITQPSPDHVTWLYDAYPNNDDRLPTRVIITFAGDRVVSVRTIATVN